MLKIERTISLSPPQNKSYDRVESGHHVKQIIGTYFQNKRAKCICGEEGWHSPLIVYCIDTLRLAIDNAVQKHMVLSC